MNLASRIPAAWLAFAGALWATCPAAAQVTAADYDRALGLRERYQRLARHVPESAVWIQDTSRFWYRRTVADGHEFMVFDAETRQKRPAFDHARLAAAVSEATGETHTPYELPFNTIAYGEKEQRLEVTVAGTRWTCGLTTYDCRRAPESAGGWRGWGGRGGPVRDLEERAEREPKPSPDGRLEALVISHNVAVRPADGGDVTMLTFDGSEGNVYDIHSLAWSPDSTTIAVYRIRPGYRRVIHHVESSPADQIQPKHSTLLYPKPGDVLDLEQPVILRIDPVRQIAVDHALFPNPYDLSPPIWRKDSSAITFEYNERGHQVFRVVEVNAGTGEARALITEQAETFFCYSCKRFRHDVADGREVIWMSERDGWNHLYLYDGASGVVKTQITRGEWVVRGVSHVDEEARQIYFSASGRDPGIDPYFVHYYRVGFDGSGLMRLTDGDATHHVQFSRDMRYYVSTYSRVDLPTVSELRRTADGSLIAEVERADISGLVEAGWKPPEVFSAAGRDGRTPIWGVIYRPGAFDSSRRYPIIEHIYAGPQGSFVPKTFAAYSNLQAQAELGFIVVQIDGMGTSNRSKAFHDVAWRNLGDAGFPDRILWHKAVAERYPSYDIGRVGLYGNSAGGQNALGGLLFHPEFYKAAVASAGCHDNRVDKLWWNEQWMGWPIGPHYAEASNVEHAHRLQGGLLLVVGELDTNVDPASTMQVVNALVKANKPFDLLVIPGGGHGPGGRYGERKRFDFFVRQLLGTEPPPWTEIDRQPAATAARFADPTETLGPASEGPW